MWDNFVVVKWLFKQGCMSRVRSRLKIHAPLLRKILAVSRTCKKQPLVGNASSIRCKPLCSPGRDGVPSPVLTPFFVACGCRSRALAAPFDNFGQFRVNGHRSPFFSRNMHAFRPIEPYPGFGGKLLGNSMRSCLHEACY